MQSLNGKFKTTSLQSINGISPIYKPIFCPRYFEYELQAEEYSKNSLNLAVLKTKLSKTGVKKAFFTEGLLSSGASNFISPRSAQSFITLIFNLGFWFLSAAGSTKSGTAASIFSICFLSAFVSGVSVYGITAPFTICNNF